ncbi:MAG: FHA domain-containing protein [Gemmatimonadetes bacterium]|nr:FHA domain-containing protein [Gemmatimonadota bacterium]
MVGEGAQLRDRVVDRIERSGEGVLHDLERESRGAEADLRLADTGISRAHAEIHLEGTAATLVDLQSTNGTTVNGQRVTRTALSDGDRISLGTTTLTYRTEG